MALDPKMKKAIYATIWTIFLGIACFITVYAANQYLWEARQHGNQQIIQPVDGYYLNFTLDTGYVGVQGYSYADENPVLHIETHKENLTLQIQCLNPVELSDYYNELTLDLYKHNTTIHCGQLNLLSDEILNYTLTFVGTYEFDYKISYLPSSVGNTDIQLFIDVIDGT